MSSHLKGHCTVLLMLIAIAAVPAARAADPTDNPVATFYSGPEGYPAWTDRFRWSKVINMKTYAKGKTAFEKFEKARDEMSEGGGVLYYPAGTYDFSTMPPGRGLMLSHDVMIRGEAPVQVSIVPSGKNGADRAANGNLKLSTKFIFPFRQRGGGKVPADWNFIGMQIEKGKYLRNSTDHIGIAWVHLIGAAVYFGPETDWRKTWGTSGSPLSPKVRKGWDQRRPDGTHPFDLLAGGGKTYLGAGSGRLVFGCIIEDAPPVNDYLDPGYGPDGFSTPPNSARIAAYGSRVLVAKNVLPKSRKSFAYVQQTSRGKKTLLYDYGKTCGIDVNKELLAPARDDGACPGYVEEGVIVRDNYVFNHGHTGFSIAGNWVTITGNHNERAYLRQGDKAYPVAPWTLTLDGYEVAGPLTDNRSRAFDLAGRNLWIDSNRFTNTGSAPGKDGEGICCRQQAGTPVYSWAITHNIHKRGTGAAGSMGGADADCHGLLIAWNQTPGWVGNFLSGAAVKMNDCAFVANKCAKVLPDKKTASGQGLPPPLTVGPAVPPGPPTKVTAATYQDDAVKITWAPGSGEAIGYRVERSIAAGKWHVIAYRPPRLQGDPNNLQAWVDFTAPTEKELSYRVVAIGGEDDDKGASQATAAVTLSR
jgi:hypothetical protein